jgi:glycosyltransferase involved in cell wall biosynthesis
MRIAFATPFISRLGGGVLTVVEALSRSLVDEGHDVRVFGVEDAGWRQDRDSWSGAPVVALRRWGPAALAYAPSMTAELIAFNPELVHVHGIWTHVSRSVLNWSQATGKPYIVSPHGMLMPWALQRSRLKKTIAGRLYEHRHINGAACLHALCAPEADAIYARGLRPPVAVVPNATVMPAAASTKPEPAWKSRVSSGQRVMLFLGRLSPEKNLLQFLEAWAKSGAGRKGWSFVMAGWDLAGYELQLKAHVETLDLSRDVGFVGSLFGEEKDAALRAADAFVLPSVSEGLPMSVLEAWSYGLPVLMTDACNLPQGFAAGAARRLDLDPSCMARDLNAFLGLPETERKAMGQAARRLARTSFNWSKIAKDFTDVYRFAVSREEAAHPPNLFVEHAA